MKVSDYKNIYMIGIGGISMSGIAEILVNWGYKVSGSDGISSNITERLKKKGIKVFIGQKEENITDDIDLIVYSAAIKEDNPEMIAAKRKNILTIERGNFLGELTKLFPKTIGVSGTHGKTTTTSMLSCCFLAANMDPSIQVGSLLKQINGNYRVGKSDFFIIEACEYCDSFLNFKQESAIVTNIDDDHLDYFKNMDNIIKSFKKYVSLLPSSGYLVINQDDEYALKIIGSTKANVIKYSIKTKANVYAKNISFDDKGCGKFELYQQDDCLGTVCLNVPGVHNVSNAVAAAAMALAYKIDFKYIQQGLYDYSGASRRLEFKGFFKNAKVYDDYGHHPTEIIATSNAIHKTKYNESWVIFEPHTYSRANEHKKEFAKALKDFDHIILIDIYAAREKNVYGITEDDLVKEISVYNSDVIHISNYEEIINYLASNVNDNDIILTLGAGYVTKIADMLVK